MSPHEKATKKVGDKQLRGAGGFKLIFFNYLQNCHCVYFVNYSQIF